MFFSIYLRKSKIIFILVLTVSFLIITYLCYKKINATDEKEGIKVPIIMYHGLTKEKKMQSKFVISVDLFENDLKYLSENGYTTIFFSDLVKYVNNEYELPQKPIILSFDDGYYNNYYYAFPLSVKYKSKIVVSPIAKYTEKYSEIDDTNINYAHLDWDNIKEMVASGFVEIGNHSYDLHQNKMGSLGIQKFYNENQESYKKRLSEDILKSQKLIKEHTDIEPIVFVYPFGMFYKNSCDILKSLGFKVTVGCEGKMNLITKDANCLYKLGRFIRSPNVFSYKYFKSINLIL